MPLLKRKPNGEFEDWRVYTPAANALSSPDSRTRKRKVKSEDTGLHPTSSLTSSDLDRSTKRTRKVKFKAEDGDLFGGAGGVKSRGTSAGSHASPMATGTSLHTNNPSAVAGNSTGRDTRQGDPSSSTVDSWFSDPAHGYSIPTPSTSRAKKAGLTPGTKMAPPKALAKAKTPREPKPTLEKRGAIFKKKCPRNILDRLDRVIGQRFFMIDRERDGYELKETFKVLGSTGNVYTVVIDYIPRCNCPDASKGNHCKHIIFVFIKVLQVAQESSHWYQKALLTTELQDVFANAPNAVANERLRQAHLQATGKAPASDSLKASNRRMLTEEDDCPICYDKMHTEPENRLTWCEVCGNALHRVCFAQWRATAQNSGKNVTCVWCRAEWVLPNADKGKSKAIGEEGYVNLAAVAGVSPQRDTSSYYHGVRRGSSYYGYQKYGA